MAKTIIHVTMSLDGFIARLDDDISWAFKYGTDEAVTEIIRGIGAVVMGNRGLREGRLNESMIPYGGW